MRAGLGLAFVCVATVLLGLGCEQSGMVSGVQPVDDGSMVSVGDTHNDVLKRVHERQGRGEDVIDAALEAANEVAAENDLKPLNRGQLEEAYRWGQEKAQQNPLQLLEEYLSPEEFDWFTDFAEYAFATEATAEEVEARYHRFAAIRPVPGGSVASRSPLLARCGLEEAPVEDDQAKHTGGEPLECMMGTLVASAKYWSNCRPKQAGAIELSTQWEDLPKDLRAKWLGNEFIGEPLPQLPGWIKRALVFLVTAAVDAIATYCTLPSGPIIAATIGALASTGAECILTGGNCGNEEDDG